MVGTPIGNLGDMTHRAVEVLKGVDWVAAEDTRRAGLLMKRFGFKTRLVSYHDFNKTQRTPMLIKSLTDGQSVAVISDAGLPGISDPAYYLVTRALANDVTVVPVPGANAALSALVVSGLPTDRFVFEGFLPAKKGRNKRLERLRNEERTLIFYEAPHRLVRTLEDLLAVLGNRRVAVARELTKLHEEVVRSNLFGALEHFRTKKPKGEFVIVTEGAKTE